MPFVSRIEKILLCLIFGSIVNAQLSPNSVARCPAGSVKSMVSKIEAF